MKITQVIVTPITAQKYLDTNKNNRKIKPTIVDRYFNDMKKNRWKEGTGETIKIGTSGRLLDGQHRLTALVKSGKNFQFSIATDVEESVFDVLDTGSVRNAGDAFFIKKVPYSHVIPSIISTYKMLKEGRKNADQHPNIRPTTSMIYTEYSRNKGYWEEVAAKSVAWYDKFAKIIAPSTIGGIYALLSDVSQADADKFMNQLCTGMEIENSAIAMLRNSLMQNRIAQRKMSPPTKNGFILKTWNLYRKNGQVKRLLFSLENDPFPIPQ